jgi:hypothetical protein
MIQLEYECKRCGVRFGGSYTGARSDGPQSALGLVWLNRIFHGDEAHHQISLHFCPDGGLGLADLVGLSPEEVKDGSDAV